jgi:hypothetical protein
MKDLSSIQTTFQSLVTEDSIDKNFMFILTKNFEVLKYDITKNEFYNVKVKMEDKDLSYNHLEDFSLNHIKRTFLEKEVEILVLTGNSKNPVKIIDIKNGDCVSLKDISIKRVLYGHATHVQNDYLFLFGGHESKNELIRELSNRISVLEFRNNEKKEEIRVKYNEGKKLHMIKPRKHSSIFMYEENIYVYGGVDINEESYGDLYKIKYHHVSDKFDNKFYFHVYPIDIKSKKTYYKTRSNTEEYEI